jgi:hypothetical protein
LEKNLSLWKASNYLDPYTPTCKDPNEEEFNYLWQIIKGLPTSETISLGEISNVDFKIKLTQKNIGTNYLNFFGEDTTDPLIFWNKIENTLLIPQLSKFAQGIFNLPSGSAMVERHFIYIELILISEIH